jgi:hypothetical protein
MIFQIGIAICDHFSCGLNQSVIRHEMDLTSKKKGTVIRSGSIGFFLLGGCAKEGQQQD